MSLLRIDASIRAEGSHSRELADIVEREWRSARPGAAVLRRELGLDPLPSGTWAVAVAAGYVAQEERSPQQREAVALAEALAGELVAADALLFAVPFYNFGVSQHFKSWVDLVLTHSDFYPGGPSPIAGKPAVLVVARGGAYGPGTPRDGWDHAMPWMRRILQDVWQLDLEVVELEFTLAGVSPALDAFKDVAADLRVAAHESARAQGKLLGRWVAA